METSWLIQRLLRPVAGNGPVETLSKALAFGGGLRNGGLSEDAMQMIAGIFRFDYMGASEFEWGAVPDALRKLAKNRKELEACTVDVDNSTVYVICHRDESAEVADRIRGWAAEPYSHLKEQPRLHQTLLAGHEARVCGWLELDNGFFFFVDEAMFSATADLFGVDVRAVLP